MEKIKFKDLEIYKLAIDNAFDHIVITDNNGKIVYANTAAQNMTGFKKEEMIGNNPSLWGRQMDGKFYEKMWKRIKEEKKTFVGELINKRKNGELYNAEIRISPILDDKKKIIYFVGIERDITKAKEIDRQKSEFVSLASHQLKNPLAVANGYLQIILSKKIPEYKKNKYIKEIFVANTKMMELIDLLLNISRIELGVFSFKHKKIDLIKILKEEIKEISFFTKNKKILVTTNFPNNADIFSDAKLLRIIFQNLLSNATKYNVLDGKIIINVVVKKKENNVLLSFKDTGIGIPNNQKNKIFGRMFRAKNAIEFESDGVGLGLYIIKGIISKIHGQIWFESEKNKGTTFFVQLPIKK